MSKKDKNDDGGLPSIADLVSGIGRLGDDVDVDTPNVEVKDPIIQDKTRLITLGSLLIGIVVVWLGEMGFVSPLTAIEWIPLGIIIFSLIANPILDFQGVNQALVTISQFLLVLSYTIVYIDRIANALIIAFVLIFAIIIFEFPRRFQLGEAEESYIEER